MNTTTKQNKTKNKRGENGSWNIHLLSCVISPAWSLIWLLDICSGFREGRTRVIITLSSPVYSPRRQRMQHNNKQHHQWQKRGEPPQQSSYSPYVQLRPYYIISIKHQFDQKCQFNKTSIWAKMVKCEMYKLLKMWKSSCDLPLRSEGVDFGLKTGSRGTPWNSKSAGPGGSENTNCRFWPFKWHFGLFQGGSIFDTFFVIF